MKMKFLIVAAILSLSLPAMAEFVTVSRAYEIALGDLTAPLTVNSKMMFSECSECDSRSIRVTPNTRYAINGRRMGLEKFRAALERIDRIDHPNKVPVTVLHHLESNTVVSVSVYFRHQK